MGTMAPQITSLTNVYSTVYSGADQRKHQSSASLAFVWVNSPVTGEFPIQGASNAENISIWWHHVVVLVLEQHGPGGPRLYLYTAVIFQHADMGWLTTLNLTDCIAAEFRYSPVMNNKMLHKEQQRQRQNILLG